MNNISTTTISSIVIQLTLSRTGIQQIGHPILFTVGMIGVILNIAIFCRRSMRQNSCALYFHANSWANLIALTWGVLGAILAFFTNNNPMTYNVAYCKIRSYMTNFSQYSSRAFLILACLDRFLLCSTSVRQRNFCRPKIAKRAIPVTTFLCACLTMYILIAYMPGQRIIPCAASTPALLIYDTVLPWVFVLFIPTISMTVMSVLILKRLKANAKRVGRDHIRVAGKDVQLTGMLIGQVTLYLVTNLSYCSYLLYGKLTESIPASSKSAERIAIEGFFSTFFTTFLVFFFNALSFFVYTLTAPSFRRELSMMIPLTRCLQKVHPSNHQQVMSNTQNTQPTKETYTSMPMKKTVNID